MDYVLMVPQSIILRSVQEQIRLGDFKAILSNRWRQESYLRKKN